MKHRNHSISDADGLRDTFIQHLMQASMPASRSTLQFDLNGVPSISPTLLFTERRGVGDKFQMNHETSNN